MIAGVVDVVVEPRAVADGVGDVVVEPRAVADGAVKFVGTAQAAAQYKSWGIFSACPRGHKPHVLGHLFSKYVMPSPTTS